MRILYWNTFRKALHEEILCLTEEHNCNLIITLENTGEDSRLVNSLRYLGAFEQANIKFNKAKLFYDKPIISIEELHNHLRYGIYRLNLLDDYSILCCIVHFPSKLHWGDPTDYWGLCANLRSDIERIELEFGTKRSFIVGDFNMNPFEKGITNTSGLNNVSVKSIAKNRIRKIHGREYTVFYNPMWNFFGESSKGKVPGTFFYNTSKYLNHYWNMYDQLMIRPELLEFFDEDNFDILHKVQGKSLLKKIRNIDVVNNSISDHLPLFIKFNEI